MTVLQEIQLCQVAARKYNFKPKENFQNWFNSKKWLTDNERWGPASYCGKAQGWGFSFLDCCRQPRPMAPLLSTDHAAWWLLPVITGLGLLGRHCWADSRQGSWETKKCLSVLQLQGVPSSGTPIQACQQHTHCQETIINLRGNWLPRPACAGGLSTPWDLHMSSCQSVDRSRSLALSDHLTHTLEWQNMAEDWCQTCRAIALFC